MIKREFKVNFKSFVIWLSILVVMFLVVFLIYPYILTDETVKNLDEMMKVFPPDLLKAFNMDLTSINSAYGWLKSEGFMFVLLVIGIYSSSLGLNLLLKEESDKTIEYLGVLPIKRGRVFTNKVIVGLTYIVLITIILSLFNYICLEISGDFYHKQYILLSLTPILVALPLFSFNLFLSTFMHKTNGNMGISLGMVFFFYVINVLSELSDKVEFLKYFSVYTLADIRDVISNVKVEPIYIVISLLITIIFITLSYIKYNKKELI